MSTPSNLYAEKVFAEHPIALWSLDDEVTYTSLIDDFQRDVGEWINSGDFDNSVSFENETAILETTPNLGFPALIFPNSYTTQIFCTDVLENETGTVTMASDMIFQPGDFDPKIKTVSIGTYVYPFSKSISFSIGYYYEDLSNQPHYALKNFYIGDVQQWAYVSEMFNLPSEFKNLQVLFRATYNGPSTGYYFLLNGISIGQNSEQFNMESLGLLPNNINNQEDYPIFETSIFGTRAESYGLQSKNAYYLTNQNGTFCAINSGMPLVYGAVNSTQITPNDSGKPSLIIPGFGFLNEEGQHKDLTLEMWIRIHTKTTEPLRIIGPIASEDGLYVNDSFLILKIGNQEATYYINEWSRPMLVAIRYTDESISVVINGEEVMSISLLGETLSLPSNFITIDNQTYNQDWIGFYAYTDIPLIEIDCVGIYPYTVPAIMEKRRWIYGQGVSTPSGISSTELSSSIATDFTVSNYVKNYAYPDLGRWQQGINENLSIDNQSISLPQYNLPIISFSNRTLDEWYQDVPNIDHTFGTAISLRPNTTAAINDWSSTEGYILFKTLNMLNQDTKAFYALFESDELNTEKQMLFSIENEMTKDILEVTLENTAVTYSIKYLNPDGSMSDPDPLYTTEGTPNEHVPGQFLFAGIEIAKFSQAFGGRVSTLFGSKQQLKVYVGGDRTLSNTFTGKIYRVGFCTARNLQKISNAFASNGIAIGYNELEASYVYDAEGFAGSSPTTITDYSEALIADGGDSYFGNTNTVFEEIIDGGSVYSILVDKILSHVASYTLIPKTFLGTFKLDIAVNGYWQDYVPLSYFGKYVNDGRNNKYYDLDFIQYNISYPAIQKYINHKYDTSNSVVKTYISFDYLKNKATIDASYYTSTIGLGENNVIEPDSNWYKRLYEITDNTIIYPPPGIDFKTIALVLHVEILSNGIVESPAKIQSLQLSSQALNSFVANPVGTKYGSDIYPYRKAGGYFDYKGRNPFSMFKSNMPYLYLTEKSGFRLHNMDGITIERGIGIPVNKNAAQYHKLSGLQFNALYDGESFPDGIKEIFHIQANEKYIRIYMQKDSSTAQRARLYAVDALTGLPQDGIVFYINGRKVSVPVININSWQMIGMMFNTPIDFSGQIGAIRMTGPLVWNNLIQYQASEADEAARSVYRKWFSVKTVNEEDKDWQYWLDLETTPGQSFAWRDVLFVSSQDTSVLDGGLVYRKYTGANRIIIDTENVFRLKNYQYSVYNDLIWSTSTVTPA